MLRAKQNLCHGPRSKYTLLVQSGVLKQLKQVRTHTQP
jgi:hypothetical protein